MVTWGLKTHYPYRGDLSLKRQQAQGAPDQPTIKAARDDKFFQSHVFLARRKRAIKKVTVEKEIPKGRLGANSEI
jgi:hypothetical protein